MGGDADIVGWFRWIYIGAVGEIRAIAGGFKLKS